MAQQFRAFAALIEDMGLAPNPKVVASQPSTAQFWELLALFCTSAAISLYT